MEDKFLKGQIAQDFDFYRIRETISSYAASEEGRDEVLARESTSDESTIRELKSLGREWSRYIDSTRPQALYSWPPVKEYFPILSVEGATLNQEQIFALGLFAAYSEKTKDAVESASIELEIPHLKELCQQMPSLSNPKNEIFRIIDISSGEIRDLPQLREIRARISKLRREIENALRKYTSDSSLSGALQSNVPAYRADRELLAVRADHKSAISGIVHEVSATGQTLYIEPEEIVRANNELVQEEFNLHAELHKIFQELTSSISMYKEDFENTLQTMKKLDASYAAARWGKATRGVFAEECDMSHEPPFINGARHPLLGEKTVPVTISFMGGKNVLIITGPNTGGKTVTLKTIALFALLNQAGFPIPANEPTRLPVFSSIFADIGDEQSIDESLSTFSSRMKKIALALNNADERSLVLLDELGSGTDPLEGSAIAMATLDSLLKKESFVIATTHHGILKNYGYTNPKCINASVEFDTTTLRPTYKLLMGVPGSSHAVEIASHSGLSQEAINNARHYISTEQADVSVLIKGLTKKHEELDQMMEDFRRKERELSEKEIRIHNRENRLKEKEIELKEIEHTNSSAFLRETRSQLENLVRVLREGEITREKTLGVKSFLEEISQKVDEQNDNIDNMKSDLQKEIEEARKEEERFTANGMRISKAREERQASKTSKKSRSKMKNSEALKNAKPIEYDIPEPKQGQKTVTIEELFVPGAEVLAGSQRRQGILVRKVKDKIWQVQFGSMKMNVPQQQLVPVKPKDTAIVAQKTAIIISDSSSNSQNESPKFELRLLGMRYEEAMKSLEHQLDLCAIHNFKNFSVVHGKGTGVLQQAVHDYLSHYPGVKEFHFARPEEGGSGKTYVELL